MFSVLSPFSKKKVSVTKVEEIDKETYSLYNTNFRTVSTTKYRNTVKTVWTPNSGGYSYIESTPYIDCEYKYDTKSKKSNDKYLKITFRENVKDIQEEITFCEDDMRNVFDISLPFECILHYTLGRFTSFEIKNVNYLCSKTREDLFFSTYQLTLLSLVAIKCFYEIYKEWMKPPMW